MTSLRSGPRVAPRVPVGSSYINLRVADTRARRTAAAAALPSAANFTHLYRKFRPLTEAICLQCICLTKPRTLELSTVH